MNGTLNLFPADGYTKMFENMLLNNPDITGNKNLSKATHLLYNIIHMCCYTTVYGPTRQPYANFVRKS